MPGHPEQNGRHERMHRTLGEETAHPPRKNGQEQQLAFDRFRAEYNDVRPHEALEQKTPSSRYSPSSRAMPSSLKSPEYPDEMKVRRLDAQGRLAFRKDDSKTTLTKLLAHEPVGLLQTGEDRFDIFYGSTLLAHVTLQAKEVRFERVK